MKQRDTDDVWPDDAALVVDQLGTWNAPTADRSPWHIARDQLIKAVALGCSDPQRHGIEVVTQVPAETVTVKPGSFVVHPPGELHEWITGPERTLLFRVRYGDDMSGRTKEWPSNPDFRPRPEDAEYFKAG